MEDSTYYKRCLWVVLQEIDTPEALNLIEEFTYSDHKELAEQAKYRIYRMNDGA